MYQDKNHTYVCATSSYGLQSTILQAEYIGPNSLVCTAEAGYVNGAVYVWWIGPNVEHILESEIDFINGMWLYVLSSTMQLH